MGEVPMITKSTEASQPPSYDIREMLRRAAERRAAELEAVNKRIAELEHERTRLIELGETAVMNFYGPQAVGPGTESLPPRNNWR